MLFTVIPSGVFLIKMKSDMLNSWLKELKKTCRVYSLVSTKKQRQNPITSVWDVEVGGLNLSHSSYCWSLCITDHIKEYVEGSY